MTTLMSCSDEHDAHALAIVNFEDEARQVLLLFRIHPRHRLVEQEKRRFHGERTAELDTLLESVGKRRNRLISDTLDLEKINDLFDNASLAYLFFLLAAPIQPGGQNTAAHVRVPA